jgi:hypothetical protein
MRMFQINTSPIDLNGEVEAENRKSDDSLDHTDEFELSGSHVNCSPTRRRSTERLLL